MVTDKTPQECCSKLQILQHLRVSSKNADNIFFLWSVLEMATERQKKQQVDFSLAILGSTAAAHSVILKPEQKTSLK